MPEQTISGNSATLWVKDIVATEAIVSVWAHVKDFTATAGNSAVPLTQLPRVELNDMDGDGKYEGTYCGFTVSGTYKITF